MLRALGLPVSARSEMFRTEPADEILEAARALEDQFNVWKIGIFARFSKFDRDELTTAELARVFEISDFSLHVWIKSSQLVPSRATGRQNYFTKKSVERLFLYQAQSLQHPGVTSRSRGPLATLFVEQRERISSAA